MGQHVFTLRLASNLEDPSLKNGESGLNFQISPEKLYQTLSSLRNSLFDDIDTMDAAAFREAIAHGAAFNDGLGKLEELGAIALEGSFEDEED